MTSLPRTTEGPSDAEMIIAARGGDLDAFGVLYGRHLGAAQRLARQLAWSQAEADDLVSEAFAKVLDSLRSGGGPEAAFRAYLLTTLRNLRYDRLRRDKKIEYSGDLTDLDPGVPFVDTAVQELESQLVAKAFASLPERWRTVLWHTEVEGESPAQVAPILGLTPNGVSALAYRAREGLRQAYLRVHLAESPGEGCRSTVERLGAWARHGLSRRDQTQVDAHLAGCTRCQQLSEEVTDINHGLLGVVAAVVVGAPWAAAYLGTSMAGPAAAGAAGGAIAAAGYAAVAAGATAGTAGGAAALGGAAGAAAGGAAVTAGAGLATAGGTAGGAAAGGAALAGGAGIAGGIAAGGIADPSGLVAAAGAGGVAGATAAAKFGLLAAVLQLPGMAKLGAGIGTAVVAGGLVISLSHPPAQDLKALPPVQIVAPSLLPAPPPVSKHTTAPPSSRTGQGPAGTEGTAGTPAGPETAPPPAHSPAQPPGSTAATGGSSPPAGTSTPPPTDPGAPETRLAPTTLAVGEASPNKDLIAGKQAQLAILVSNVSENPVTGLSAHVDLPVGFELRGADVVTDDPAKPKRKKWKCRAVDGGAECTLGTLPPGDSTLQLKVMVAADAPAEGKLGGSIDTVDGGSAAIPSTQLTVSQK